MPITGTAIYKLNQILIQISVTIFKDLGLTTLKEYGGTKTILRKKLLKTSQHLKYIIQKYITTTTTKTVAYKKSMEAWRDDSIGERTFVQKPNNHIYTRQAWWVTCNLNVQRRTDEHWRKPANLQALGSSWRHYCLHIYCGNRWEKDPTSAPGLCMCARKHVRLSTGENTYIHAHELHICTYKKMAQ